MSKKDFPPELELQQNLSDVWPPPGNTYDYIHPQNNLGNRQSRISRLRGWLGQTVVVDSPKTTAEPFDQRVAEARTAFQRGEEAVAAFLLHEPDTII